MMRWALALLTAATSLFQLPRFGERSPEESPLSPGLTSKLCVDGRIRFLITNKLFFPRHTETPWKKRIITLLEAKSPRR